MRYPVNEFKEKWYIALQFGASQSYGFHEGCDINLKTGGDSDLGEMLLAIANGEITSVHEHTTIPSFGKHLHLRIETPFGTRFVHYAHCQEILVKTGDLVSEGQLIAKLGKSGTKVAHCHFAIKKQPTGIDGLAKTKDDLLKWEDPIVFIEKCIAFLDDKYRLIFQGKEIDTYERNPKDEIQDLQAEVKRLNTLLENQKLTTIAKEAEIRDLKTSLEAQELDNQDLSAQKLKAEGERDTAVREKKEALNKVDGLNQTIETQKTRLDSQDEEIKGLRNDLKAVETLTIHRYPWWTRFKSLFTRGGEKDDG